MKRQDLKEGEIYLARYAGKLTKVKLIKINANSSKVWRRSTYSYDVENLTTGRRLTFWSAMKFRPLLKASK